MTKTDLIKKVQQSIPHYPPGDVATAVNVVFDSIRQIMKNKERLEIRGFGIFSLRYRPERRGCNPKTGKVFTLPQRRAPFFKASKELQCMLNKTP